MRYFHSINLVFLFCFFWQDLRAQESEYFLQTHLNNQNGLAQNSIRDLIFSESGFMWLATEDGLVCYNGKSAKIYTTNNSSLTTNRISQFLPSKNGKLYCITGNHDLFEINEKAPNVTIRFLEKIPNIGLSIYHLFTIDSLAQFNAICKTIVPENLYRGSQSSFYLLDKKKMVAQKNRDGFLIYSQSLKLIKKISISVPSKNFFFTQNDELYFYNNSGNFYWIDMDNDRVEKLKSNTPLFSDGKLIWNAKMGDAYWVGNHLLCEIQIKNKEVKYQIKLTGLPELDIENITQNKKNQDIVIGTTSNGVYIYHKRLFKIHHSNSSNDVFYAQCPTADSNSIYSGNPLQIIGESNFNKIEKEDEYSYEQNSMYRDKDLNCWFAKRDTLFCIDHKTNRVSKSEQSTIVQKKKIFCLHRKDDASFYFGTAFSIFTCKIDSGISKTNDFPENIIQPYCMLKVSDSIILIGTHIGIYQLNVYTNRLNYYCLSNRIVRALFKASNGLILAGTYGNGIYHIKNNQAYPIPIDKNENLKSTHTFMEDRQHIIWMSSNNGLYKVSLHELNDYISGKQDFNPYYYRYSYDDGFMTNEFNGGCFPSAIAINHSTWSFPTMKGLVWFKPNEMPSGQNNSAIFIDKIVLNDIEVNTKNSNLINTETHRFKLSIYFSSPNWTDDNNLQLEYKLDGKDEHSSWKLILENNAPLEFQNLSGGQHILKVRKRNGIASRDFQEMSIKIEVPKLFYEHKWFWWLALLILAACIYAINRISVLVVSKKKRKLELLVDSKTTELREAIQLLEKQNTLISESENELKKENELKSTLLFLLSHDIASPLRHINYFLGSSLHPINKESLTESDLVDLKISTNNLENLLDNIVAWIKHTNQSKIQPRFSEFNLHKVVDEKISLFELAIKKKDIRVHNLIDLNCVLRSDQFICSMAIQNLLGNAINYIQEGSIEISFVETITHYSIIVTDTGIGISEEMLSLIMAKNNDYSNHSMHQSLGGYGIGIKITNQLLALIDGELIFTQNKNIKGTIATISIKKSNLVF